MKPSPNILPGPVFHTVSLWAVEFPCVS